MDCFYILKREEAHRQSPPLISSSLPHVPFYVHSFIIMQQLLSYGCM